MNIVVWTIFFATIGLIGCLFEWRGKFLGWIARIWGKAILKVGGIQYKVNGLENLDPNSHYVFAANHESAMDIPLTFASLPFHIVSISKIELKRIPIFGWAMMAGGHFFVDRRNHKKAMKSLEKAKKSMTKNPRSIILYPEGTRSMNGEIMPFKKGGLIWALQMGVPVVPVALCGTRDTLKKKSLVLKNHPLIVEVGAPIETASLTFEDRQQYVTNVQEAVVALKAKWQENGSS